MLDKGNAGIFFLEPYDPKRVPVLFVPGIAGTPRSFRRMIESLDRTRFQAWLFNYPSGLRTTSTVTLLRDVLTDLEREHRFNTLLITAHSLGGLIAYSYVRSGFAESERVKVLVTFSSPWMGNSWAASGTRNMPMPVPVWADLSPESPYLASLREPIAPNAFVPLHYVFFGYRRKASVLMTESSDGVISVASQIPTWIQDRAERYWGYDATHVGILSDDSVLERYNALLDSTADRLEHLEFSAEPPGIAPARLASLDELDKTPAFGHPQAKCEACVSCYAPRIFNACLRRGGWHRRYRNPAR